MSDQIIISVIIPVFNCVNFIEECFKSIESQELEPITDLAVEGSPKERLLLEISIYEDGSTDGTSDIVEEWIERFQKNKGFYVKFSKNNGSSPKGVGYGRNRAIEQATGEYLCFCDADDIMGPTRVITQYSIAKNDHNTLIGSKFTRIPEGSTANFTYWANNLSKAQLETQVYLTFGPSLVMPTWFCHKKVYENVPQGFDESGKGTPEDLIFFYKHLDSRGKLIRADESLMIYRYHPTATTFSVSDATIWNIRLERLETVVLSKWDNFTIWNAGKSGRRFYRSLKESNRNKVIAFCDVDKKKINQKTYHPYPLKIKIPIVHPKDASPPLIICVKTDLIWDENGDFRKILDSLGIQEGNDFYYFN